MIESAYQIPSGSRITLTGTENRAGLPLLVKDEIVSGTVLKSLASQKALLVIRGKPLVAQTPFPLNPGSRLALKVLQTDPLPVFKLQGGQAGPPANINAAAVLSFLSKDLWEGLLSKTELPNVPRRMLEQMKGLIKDISREGFKKPSADLLQKVIQKSGLAWEAKLGRLAAGRGEAFDLLAADDLKGLGSQILTRAGSDPLLERLLGGLESMQLLNRLGFMQEGKLLFPIPMQFPDGYFSMGQLLLQIPSEDPDKDSRPGRERPFSRICFLLNLSEIGPLRVDLMVRDKIVSGRFFVTSNEARSRVEADLPLLKERLSSIGFQAGNFRCRLKGPETFREPLIKEMLPEEESTVSFLA